MIWKLTGDCWWSDQLTATDQLQGAKAIIAVADNLDIDPNRYDVPFFRIPLADNCDLDPGTIGFALDAMKSCKNRGLLPFILMCRAGQSRSASFAALWLAWKEGIPYQQAMTLVRDIRKEVFPHEKTWKQLEEFSKTVPLDTFFIRMSGTLRDQLQLARLMWIRKHLLPPPSSILDIGAHNGGTLTTVISECRMGEFLPLREFQELMKDVPRMGYGWLAANDIREDLRQHWNVSNAGIPFSVFDAGIEVWPYSSNSFDTVLLCELLEHMTQPKWINVLDQAYRVCRKQILITLPIDEGLEVETNRDGTGPDDHKYRPKFSELRQFITSIIGDDPLLDLYHICHYDPTPENQILYRGVSGYDQDLGFIYGRIVKEPWW